MLKFFGQALESPTIIYKQKLGCHIITAPPAIIEKIEKFGNSYKSLTINTVKNFLIDSKKSNFKI